MVAVAELLVVLGSEVVEVTAAVSVIVLPDAAVTLTTRVILSELAFPMVPTVQVTVPVPPTGGAVQVPVFGLTLTNMVPVGTTSVTLIACAVSGPLFLAVME